MRATGRVDRLRAIGLTFTNSGASGQFNGPDCGGAARSERASRSDSPT